METPAVDGPPLMQLDVSLHLVHLQTSKSILAHTSPCCYPLNMILKYTA